MSEEPARDPHGMIREATGDHSLAALFEEIGRLRAALPAEQKNARQAEAVATRARTEERPEGRQAEPVGFPQAGGPGYIPVASATASARTSGCGPAAAVCGRVPAGVLLG